MNLPQRQFNQIRYNYKSKLPQDDQIPSFEENYIFKTHPSFQLSEQTTKVMPKSQNYHNQEIHKDDKFRKQNKTSIKHDTQSLINPQKQSSLHNEKQVILKQKITSLQKQKKRFQQENLNLRNYVEFLQDYNLKLKKQLMHALRRRNLDSSLGSIYDQQNQPKVQIPLRSTVENHYDSKEHYENSYFQTLEPLEKYISKPIFTNNRLINQGVFRNNSFGQGQNEKIDRNRYVSNFYQTTQKPIYNNFYKKKDSKNYDRLKKVYPTSLQSSFLNASTEINPDLYKIQKQTKQICCCLNNSVPVIKNIETPISQGEQYFRSLDHSSLKAVLKANQKQIVCHSCLKSVKIKKQNTKYIKDKSKNLKHNQKTKSLSKKRCISCHEGRSSKQNNTSKSTMPTRQKRSGNFFYSNELSKKLNDSQQQRNKPQRGRQRVQISEFHI